MTDVDIEAVARLLSKFGHTETSQHDEADRIIAVLRDRGWRKKRDPSTCSHESVVRTNVHGSQGWACLPCGQVFEPYSIRDAWVAPYLDKIDALQARLDALTGEKAVEAACMEMWGTYPNGQLMYSAEDRESLQAAIAAAIQATTEGEG